MRLLFYILKANIANSNPGSQLSDANPARVRVTIFGLDRKANAHSPYVIQIIGVICVYIIGHARVTIGKPIGEQKATRIHVVYYWLTLAGPGAQG